MGRRVNVIGVGMTKFAKPGASEDYNVMATKAARAALEDARVDYADVEQAYAGYVFGDSTCGQRAIYDVGLTGVPVFNVNNNCSTGSTALMLGRQAVEGGVAECVLVVGFEKMEKGALESKFTDRTNPLEYHANVLNKLQGFTAAPPAAQMFGGAGREYRWKYGTKRETFAKVAEKARKHAANNPYAIFNQPLTVEEILASDEVFDPLTRYQCCPPTCGAAAAPSPSCTTANAPSAATTQSSVSSGAKKLVNWKGGTNRASRPTPSREKSGSGSAGGAGRWSVSCKVGDLGRKRMADLGLVSCTSLAAPRLTEPCAQGERGCGAGGGSPDPRGWFGARNPFLTFRVRWQR